LNALAALAADPLKWSSNKLVTAQTSWEDFVAVMADHDGPWANRQTRYRARVALTNLVQGDLSVAEYGRLADELIAKLPGMLDDEKYFWFLRGLHPSLCDRMMFDPVTGKEWSTATELGAYALNIGADFKARFVASGSGFPPDQPSKRSYSQAARGSVHPDPSKQTL